MLTVVACGGGKPPGAHKAAPKLDAADVAAIVLAEADAPAGTQFEAETSGVATVEDIAETDEEKAILNDAGFRGAHQSTIATPGMIAAENPASLGSGARLIASLAIALEDESAATRVMEAFQKDLRAEAQGVEAISVQGGVPGEAGYAVSFSAIDAQTPLSGVAMLWRRGNGVFVLIVAGVTGAATEEETLNLANRMDDRAKSRL